MSPSTQHHETNKQTKIHNHHQHFLWVSNVLFYFFFLYSSWISRLLISFWHRSGFSLYLSQVVCDDLFAMEKSLLGVDREIVHVFCVVFVFLGIRLFVVHHLSSLCCCSFCCCSLPFISLNLMFWFFAIWVYLLKQSMLLLKSALKNETLMIFNSAACTFSLTLGITTNLRYEVFSATVSHTVDDMLSCSCDRI